MADSVVRRAAKAGRLHPIHLGVYSVVPPSLMTVEAWHAAAILAGGRGACLCADSAAWWAELTKQRPAEVHVAVRGDRKEIDGIRWHRLRLHEGDRIRLRGMPITRLERIPRDLQDLSIWELKGVLAELEYHHDIGPEAVVARGPKLRQAIQEHIPQLAATRSELEQTFIHFLNARGFALPQCNQREGASTVDAIYERERVAIELDGVRGHAGARRILRDHRRDLHRRADGFTPLRYSYAQLVSPHDQDLIEAELERLGIPRV